MPLSQHVHTPTNVLEYLRASIGTTNTHCRACFLGHMRWARMLCGTYSPLHILSYRDNRRHVAAFGHEALEYYEPRCKRLSITAKCNSSELIIIYACMYRHVVHVGYAYVVSTTKKQYAVACLSTCHSTKCRDSLQKQNCSFNKGLCHVSCTCVTTSFSDTTQSHFLVMWLQHSPTHDKGLC